MERLQSSNCATQESINGSVRVEECSVHTRFSERVGKEMLPKEWQGSQSYGNWCVPGVKNFKR